MKIKENACYQWNMGNVYISTVTPKKVSYRYSGGGHVFMVDRKYFENHARLLFEPLDMKFNPKKLIEIAKEEEGVIFAIGGKLTDAGCKE